MFSHRAVNFTKYISIIAPPPIVLFGSLKLLFCRSPNQKATKTRYLTLEGIHDAVTNQLKSIPEELGKYFKSYIEDAQTSGSLYLQNIQPYISFSIILSLNYCQSR